MRDGRSATTFPRATAEAVLDAMERVGLDKTAILARMGHIAWSEASGRIPSVMWGVMWSAANEQARDDPLLAARVGLNVRFGGFGLLDHLTGSAETLELALETLASNISASATLVGLQWNSPSLEVVGHSTAGPATDEFSVAVVLARLREVTTEDPAERLRLNRPKPDRVDHIELFGLPVTYDTARAGVDFKPASLAWPLITSNRSLHASLLEAATSVGIGAGASALETRVLACLPGLVANGRSDAASIASALGMSRRTLYRRLASEGLSVGSIVDGFRAREARRRLRTDESLAEIAIGLGYSDQAAFTRSFRRWFGKTPAAWRREDGQ